MKAPTLERAYELARTGQCRTVAELEKQLSAEQCNDVAGTLYGASIRKQLRQLMAEARARRHPS